MRSPLKNPDLLAMAALARHLLSPSRQFESAIELQRQASSEGLRLLGTLDKVTRLSLPAIPTPVAATSEPVRAPEPSVPSIKYQSARQEYKSALGDASVVNALLELHQQKRNPRRTLAPLGGFQAQRLPLVRSAQVKPAPHAHGATGTTPVYRSLGPTAPRTKPKP